MEVLIPGESWRVLNIFKVPGNLGRVWFRMETAGDHIYCVAGHTGRGTCNVLHRYNRCRATWRMMPRMLRRRYDFLSAILQNKIYMTGRMGRDQVYEREQSRPHQHNIQGRTVCVWRDFWVLQPLVD